MNNEIASQEEKSIQRAQEAIEHFRKGGMIILIDDESRENEGDLVIAAEDVTPESINFMAKEARGLICLTLHSQIVERLKLPMMKDHSKTAIPQMQTAFTVSIEAKSGVTTGISAHDRAHTIKVAIDDLSSAEDLIVPGHIFPLRARDGGVLERAGHTEGSVDLAKLCGKKPAAVICEIMHDDGTMARLKDLKKFSEKYNIPLVTIEDLIFFRLKKDTLVKELRRRPFATAYGEFVGIWFEYIVDRSVHFVLAKGLPFNKDVPVDIRVHKQNALEDVFSPSDSPHSRFAIDYGLNMLNKKNQGVFLYIQDNFTQNLLDSFNSDKQTMDPRLYGIGAQILKTLGVGEMNLHVRSVPPLVGLKGFGLNIKSTTLMNQNSQIQTQHKSTNNQCVNYE